MLIETEHLTNSFGTKPALADVSVTIDEGQIVAVLAWSDWSGENNSAAMPPALAGGNLAWLQATTDLCRSAPVLDAVFDSDRPQK